ncbi:MAG: hypothetical protein H7Y19_10960 [Luteimonas sp.]|nr:hypothetical protein [Luteimonas sp.]
MTRIRSTLARRCVRAQLTSVAAAIAALSAVSCGPSVEPPDVKLNPAPKQRYEITVTIDDPPSEISAVSGRIQYDIENDLCVPIADPIAGVRKYTSFTQPVRFRREGNNRYIGDVYADQLKNENYYGLGVCRWRITGVDADIDIRGSKQHAALDGTFVINQELQINLCRRAYASPASDSCMTYVKGINDAEKDVSYSVIISSRRIF